MRARQRNLSCLATYTGTQGGAEAGEFVNEHWRQDISMEHIEERQAAGEEVQRPREAVSE